MRFLSVCSGIEAASVAWHPLGWQAAAFSEIDPFACAALSHHYPDVPNWGDMNNFRRWPDANFDVLAGGTPCQSFSVAGLRAGLADPRGNLALAYLGIADRYRPDWLVWENVPGVLSSGGGADFAAIVGGMGELGYGWAYRVLDAQFFGVAQRRRRVFVVASTRGWAAAAAVLFDAASLRGDPAPSRTTGQGFTHDVAPSLTASGRGVERAGDTRGQDPVVAVAQAYDVANTLTRRMHKGINTTVDEGQTPIITGIPEVSSTLCGGANRTGGNRSPGMDADTAAGLLLPIGFNSRQDPDSWPDRTGPLDATSPQAQAVAFAQNQRDEVRIMGIAGALAAEPGMKQQTCVAQAVALRGREGGATAELGADLAGALRASQGGGDKAHVLHAMRVRKLTPRECERLQGFPDDYTLIPYRGRLATDGPRYKALGNSMAVPVMHWLGSRIQLVQLLLRSAA